MCFFISVFKIAMFLFLLQSSFDVPLLDGFESALDLFGVDPAFSVAWEISCLYFESEIHTDWLRLFFFFWEMEEFWSLNDLGAVWAVNFKQHQTGFWFKKQNKLKNAFVVDIHT